MLKRAITILAFMAAAAVLLFYRSSHKTVGPQVPTARPTRGDFEVTLIGEGVLESEKAVSVRNGRMSGKLVMIIPDGTTVKQGDLFCRIDTRDLLRERSQQELAYKQAREEIGKTEESARAEAENARRQLDQIRKDLELFRESNQANIKQKQEELDFARAEQDRLKSEYDRAQRLADRGYVPGTQAEVARARWEAQGFKVTESEKALALSREEIESQLRQKQTAVQVAERKAEVAQERIAEQVGQAKERAERARRELDDTNDRLASAAIRAPAAGIVRLSLERSRDESRPLQAGDDLHWGQHIGTISGLDRMLLSFRLSERKIASVRKDQPARIVFDALPGKTFRGRVSLVSAVARQVNPEEDPSADPEEKVFDVWVLVEAPPGTLKPGLTGKAELLVKRIPRALYLPLEAVFEREGKSLVFVQQDGHFVRREVVTGDRNDAAVVVLSGLRENERVALRDPTRGQLPTQSPESAP